ncbi:hypothetical protein [Liquorilactobacillus satsumensis]
MSFIAINGDTHQLISVLPNRFNQSIQNYFESNYSLAERRKVKQ